MRELVETAALPRGRRILVISDIHGNLPYLLGALDKVGYTPADVLIVDGDFLEKGEQSLDTLHFLMGLCEKYCVYVLRGNCDGWHQVLDWQGESLRRTMAYMAAHPDCVLRQMCRRQGLETDETTPPETVQALLRAHFMPELDFLRARPVILDTPNYTFVHGGISAGSVAEAEPKKCMKNDAFMRQDWSLGKWQIVGHWPVMLYREDITDAKPILDPRRKVISIDGGCVLKDDGQLNVLIIPYDGSEDFRWNWYDPFPTATARTAQTGGGSSYYIRWGDNAVEVLERGEEFSRCRHVRTGYEMDILTDFLQPGPAGGTVVNDSTDYRLPVAPGDELALVRQTNRGWLCKRDGVTGWYAGEVELT